MNQKRKPQARYKGSLRMHWRWSVILALSLLILDIVLLVREPHAGYIALIFSGVYFLVILLFYLYYRPRILQEAMDFALRYGLVQSRVLEEMEMPAALIEPDGRVLWLNDSLCALTERRRTYRKNISVIFPELNRGTMPVAGWERDVKVAYGDRDLRAHIQRIPMDEVLDDTSFIERVGEEAAYLYMVCFFDETQLNKVIRENRDRRPVVALCYIDNYAEVVDRTDEVNQSLLNVLVERRINKYFTSRGGLVKKLEKDKYLVVLDQKELDDLTADHFSILGNVKSISIGADVSVTISIGVGGGGFNYQENYEAARGAMEMALGRGGDQAVVKNGDEMAFYGGMTQRSESNTRVRSRVKAQAMRELMLSMDNVIAMGHSFTDMDSFGAAIGVCRAARSVGKPAHIVLGELNTNIRAWVNMFRDSKDYDPGMFITHEQAMEMTNDGTAVIVVDTSRPSRVECPQLLGMTKTVAVLDHHRTTTDIIENASLSYIETSASSACEMISEILQYFDEPVKLSTLEADCLYAGIIIDTDNFNAKTGVRTFEAAAYLRRCGADVIRVRKALRDNIDNYRAKADAVSSAETFMDAYAISICHSEGLESPNVIGARAANELLGIVGVKASFVVTPYEGKVFISARSIDEANVQLIMERLGGGGHLNMAGAQLSGVTPEEAVEKLKEVLTAMTQEGAI